MQTPTRKHGTAAQQRTPSKHGAGQVSAVEFGPRQVHSVAGNDAVFALLPGLLCIAGTLRKALKTPLSAVACPPVGGNMASGLAAIADPNRYNALQNRSSLPTSEAVAPLCCHLFRGPTCPRQLDQCEGSFVAACLRVLTVHSSPAVGRILRGLLPISYRQVPVERDTQGNHPCMGSASFKLYDCLLSLLVIGCTVWCRMLHTTGVSATGASVSQQSARREPCNFWQTSGPVFLHHCGVPTEIVNWQVGYVSGAHG